MAGNTWTSAGQHIAGSTCM